MKKDCEHECRARLLMCECADNTVSTCMYVQAAMGFKLDRCTRVNNLCPYYCPYIYLLVEISLVGYKVLHGHGQIGNAVSSFVVCSLTSKFKVHLLWGRGSGWAYAPLPLHCFAFSFLLHSFYIFHD